MLKKTVFILAVLTSTMSINCESYGLPDSYKAIEKIPRNQVIHCIVGVPFISKIKYYEQNQQDDDAERLTLIALNNDRKNSPSSWIQLDWNNKEIYGMPLDRNRGNSTFIVGTYENNIISGTKIKQAQTLYTINVYVRSVEIIGDVLHDIKLCTLLSTKQMQENLMLRYKIAKILARYLRNTRAENNIAITDFENGCFHLSFRYLHGINSECNFEAINDIRGKIFSFHRSINNDRSNSGRRISFYSSNDGYSDISRFQHVMSSITHVRFIEMNISSDCLQPVSIKDTDKEWLPILILIILVIISIVVLSAIGYCTCKKIRNNRDHLRSQELYDHHISESGYVPKKSDSKSLNGLSNQSVYTQEYHNTLANGDKKTKFISDMMIEYVPPALKENQISIKDTNKQSRWMSKKKKKAKQKGDRLYDVTTALVLAQQQKKKSTPRKRKKVVGFSVPIAKEIPDTTQEKYGLPAPLDREHKLITLDQLKSSQYTQSISDATGSSSNNRVEELSTKQSIYRQILSNDPSSYAEKMSRNTCTKDENAENQISKSINDFSSMSSEPINRSPVDSSPRKWQFKRYLSTARGSNDTEEYDSSTSHQTGTTITSSTDNASYYNRNLQNKRRKIFNSVKTLVISAGKDLSSTILSHSTKKNSESMPSESQASSGDDSVFYDFRNEGSSCTASICHSRVLQYNQRQYNLEYPQSPNQHFVNNFEIDSGIYDKNKHIGLRTKYRVSLEASETNFQDFQEGRDYSPNNNQKQKPTLRAPEFKQMRETKKELYSKNRGKLCILSNHQNYQKQQQYLQKNADTSIIRSSSYIKHQSPSHNAIPNIIRRQMSATTQEPSTSTVNSEHKKCYRYDIDNETFYGIETHVSDPDSMDCSSIVSDASYLNLGSEYEVFPSPCQEHKVCREPVHPHGTVV